MVSRYFHSATSTTGTSIILLLLLLLLLLRLLYYYELTHQAHDVPPQQQQQGQQEYCSIIQTEVVIARSDIFIWARLNLAQCDALLRRHSQLHLQQLNGRIILAIVSKPTPQRAQDSARYMGPERAQTMSSRYTHILHATNAFHVSFPMALY